MIKRIAGIQPGYLSCPAYFGPTLHVDFLLLASGEPSSGSAP